MGMLRIVFILTTFVACSPSAQAAGTPQAGQAIAERWCSSCHVVRPEQTQASADVPSFRSIAMRTEKLDWISGFLTEPHPPMPNFSLTRQEIQDLIAYFESLRTNEPALARPPIRVPVRS